MIVPLAEVSTFWWWVIGIVGGILLLWVLISLIKAAGRSSRRGYGVRDEGDGFWFFFWDECFSLPDVSDWMSSGGSDWGGGDSGGGGD